MKLSNCRLGWNFSTSKFDSSLFVFRQKEVLVVILVNVDDILVVGNNLKFIDHFIFYLNSLSTLKDLGNVSYFFGIEVIRSTYSIFFVTSKILSWSS